MYFTLFDSSYEDSKVIRGSRGRVRMVVEFATACAIIVYHPKVVSSNIVHGKVYSIQHYVK